MSLHQFEFLLHLHRLLLQNLHSLLQLHQRHVDDQWFLLLLLFDLLLLLAQFDHLEFIVFEGYLIFQIPYLLADLAHFHRPGFR